MVRLDCQNLDTTIASVSAVIGRSADDVRTALLGFDEERFADCSDDPYQTMPREVLAGLGIDPGFRVESSFFFHGSRVVDPDVFWREGILSLDQVIERIWMMLFDLVQDTISADAWAEFRRSIETDAGGHDGSLYRHKTGDRMHFGPQALLVREVFLDPQATSSHDYLGCPEIIQDIARAFQTASGIDLEALFNAATVPVLVKFAPDAAREDLIQCALWYAYSSLREDEITCRWIACGGFDGAGTAIPSEQVVDVELIPGPGS